MSYYFISHRGVGLSDICLSSELLLNTKLKNEEKDMGLLGKHFGSIQGETVKITLD